MKEKNKDEQNQNQDEIKNEFEFKHDQEEYGKNKLTVIRQIVHNIQSNLEQLVSLLGVDEGIIPTNLSTNNYQLYSEEVEGRVIEGVFDGQNMVGPDGKQYTVPSNYASKSKLVEGDILKLTITRAGGFIYKQIGPIERSRMIGTLATDEETRDYYVIVNDRNYKVLPASITYFKGEPGDEVVILVPKNNDSNWAAVENVIKKVT